MEFLAHISDDGRTQTVAEHLEATGRRSAAFAAEFGAETYGRLVGEAHDIGKTSYPFQKRLQGGTKVDHATAGAVECAKTDQIIASCCVIGHHGGLMDLGNRTDQPGEHTCIGRLQKGMRGGIPDYQWHGQLPNPGKVPEFKDEYTLSLWIRMLYSCLVDADYLDTEEFMSGGTIQRGTYASMESLLHKLEAYIEPWFPPRSELNQYRCQILQECLDKGGTSRGMYTLTVPTGGGKTVASLAFALRHAVENKMQRVIYVIPYTSIIEQNAAVFRKILGENNVIEHHSEASYDLDEEINQRKSLARLAAENWDAPVIVTTAVQFFESFYANSPSRCRKLHNIANSVIVFDEAQMLPTSHLKPCIGSIANLVAQFRATVVLCTATQPVLHDLVQEFVPDMKATEICSNTHALYTKFRRITFQNAGTLSNVGLVERLACQEQVLCIVNTRKAAQEIYELLPGEGRFHLSTLMYPVHRQRVLRIIRERLKKGLACRVVSTSLIEAGVDIDFPAVYREMAGLDSILQAGGRCNREGKRSVRDSIVTIFVGETPVPRLFRTNIGATLEALEGERDPGELESIQRYFTAYRSLVGNHLDKVQIVERFRKGISGCALPFETAAKEFHFIDQATKSLYIPLEEGEELCRALLEKNASRETYRRAGRYCVNVYEQQYQELFKSGDIISIDENSAVLVNCELYSTQTGLSLKNDCGRAEFI